MTKSPQVLGEGSYGCIHRPPLKCKSPSSVRTKGKVSKLLHKKEAETELKEYNLIQQADPDHEYYLGKPDVCDLDDSRSNVAAISKCDMGDDVLEDMDDYRLLVMEYGGKNIQEYAQGLRGLEVTDAHKKLAQEFWVDFHQVMRGIQGLIKHSMVHHDIKTPNILYCQKQRRMYLIDFGLMESIPESIQKCHNNTYEMDINWWYFPYDSIWLNQETFMDEIPPITGSRLPRYIQRQFTLKYHEKSEINNWMYSLYRMTKLTEDELDAAIDDFSEFVTETQENFTDSAYNHFVNQYFTTLDVYGLGVAGLELLGYTQKLVPDAFYHSARTFFLGLASFHPMRRPVIQTVLTNYEQILDSTGMLTFDHATFKFKNHHTVLVPKRQTLFPDDTAAKAAKSVKAAKSAKAAKGEKPSRQAFQDILEMDPVPSATRVQTRSTRKLARTATPTVSSRPTAHRAEQRTLKSY
jgi:serine/threonine protein kinase